MRILHLLAILSVVCVLFVRAKPTEQTDDSKSDKDKIKFVNKEQQEFQEHPETDSDDKKVAELDVTASRRVARNWYGSFGTMSPGANVGYGGAGGVSVDGPYLGPTGYMNSNFISCFNGKCGSYFRPGPPNAVYDSYNGWPIWWFGAPQTFGYFGVPGPYRPGGNFGGSWSYLNNNNGRPNGITGSMAASSGMNGLGNAGTGSGSDVSGNFIVPSGTNSNLNAPLGSMGNNGVINGLGSTGTINANGVLEKPVNGNESPNTNPNASNNCGFNGMNGLSTTTATTNGVGATSGCSNGNFGKPGTSNNNGSNGKSFIKGGLNALSTNALGSSMYGNFLIPNTGTSGNSGGYGTLGNNVAFGGSGASGNNNGLGFGNVVSSNGGIAGVGFRPFQPSHNAASFGFSGFNSNLRPITGANSFNGNTNGYNHDFNYYGNGYGYNGYGNGLNGYSNYGWQSALGNNPDQTNLGITGNYVGTTDVNNFGDSSFVSGFGGLSGSGNLAGHGGIGSNFGFNMIRPYRFV